MKPAGLSNFTNHILKVRPKRENGYPVKFISEHERSMIHNTEFSDRDLTLVRLRFLDLTKSFFQDAPDAQKMSRWRGIFTALAGERVNQRLDGSVRHLVHLLDQKDLQALKDEYYTLFTDPFSEYLLPVHASYYIDGRNYGPSLAKYRDFLKDAQLMVEKNGNEPEDSVPLMLDALMTLVEEEKKGEVDNRDLEERLIREFLLPTVKQLSEVAAANVHADFYRSCIVFLDGYLELEQGLLTET